MTSRLFAICGSRLHALAAFASVCLMLGVGPALAQRCVAQGDGSAGGWGPCHGETETRTIVIEIQPPPRLGPPQIVWVRPTAAGSSATSFQTVNNPAMARELADQSVTGNILLMKARTAKRNGDMAKYHAYIAAARSRSDNTRAEQRDIDDEYARAQVLYDNAAGQKGQLTIPKFEKSGTRVKVDIDGVPAEIFNEHRPELEPVRQELLPLLAKRYDARVRLEKAQMAAKVAKAEPKATAELAAAERDLRSIQSEVKRKVDKAKEVYRLKDDIE